MLAADASIVAYRHAIQSLHGLSEPQQVMALKYELFHALERAHDFQDRSRVLELDVARLCVKADRRETSEAATREGEEIGRLRQELAASESQRESLEALCRSLLHIVDGAVDDLAADRGDADHASMAGAAS